MKDPKETEREWYAWQKERDAKRRRAQIVGCVFLFACAATFAFVIIALYKSVTG